MSVVKDQSECVFGGVQAFPNGVGVWKAKKWKSGLKNAM